MNKKTKQIAGIAMLFSAISLVVTFLVLSIRKRSFVQALLILATAEGTAAAILLSDTDKMKEKVKNPFRKRRLAEGEEAEDAEAEELFDDESADAAEAQLRGELSGNGDGEEEPRKREIPRDEDATEADFQ